MEQCNKRGEPKILEPCTLPLTGNYVASRIITDLAVIEVMPDGLLLREVAPGHSTEEIIKVTGAQLKVAADVCTILYRVSY